MDNLPVELLHEILRHLPSSCLKNARLASRRFNAVLAKQAFPQLASFIDKDAALATLEATVAELSRRRRSIWSPRCSVPDNLPLAPSFLLAMHVALAGQSWRPTETAINSDSESSEDDESDCGYRRLSHRAITAQDLCRQLGRLDVTEDMLRGAMFRYALYLSYLYKGEGEAPQLWVVDSERWATSA
ncbi:hypothetical protein HIM_11890 [Hirsutella minnesotensis 3608]|uniref:F-box domain-containing protein n=1 Tax=Hirsutella minnesotensis 3608 TaxID=1043627 RepID=A0A0F7ZWC1_9HYPO|nr:hypothetical protein HIM_11890 [Hirsutella minnesotensis 3608]